jgi:hypothetical protein
MSASSLQRKGTVHYLCLIRVLRTIISMLLNKKDILYISRIVQCTFVLRHHLAGRVVRGKTEDLKDIIWSIDV